jgi:PKD repeat protein
MFERGEMNQRNNCLLTESGVSELIGAIVLIAMIVLVVAVVAAFLINRPASNEIPEVRFSVVNVSTYGQCYDGGVCSINLTHTGGDNLNPGEYSFFINDNSAPVVPGNIKPDPQSNSWSVGKTVMVNSSVVPDYIRVYYYNKTKVNNPALLGQRTIGTIPPTSTIIPTASPTTTTTTTTTTTPTPCQPPVAGFTFSQAASPPLKINFVSTSIGTGTLSYLWNFGDTTSSSTGPNVTHTYLNPGSYTVNLTVTDSCNSNSITIPVTVSLPLCGTISGTKYNDLNGNGQRDPGEPGLAGWTINVFEKNGNNWDFVKSNITNTDGTYLISGLSYQGASKFLIKETIQSGWQMTQPVSEDYYTDILLNPSNCYKTDIDFGNQCTGFTVWAWVKWINKPTTPLNNQTFATIVVKGNSNFNRQYHLEHDQDNTKFEFNIATVSAGGQGIQVFSTTNPVNGVWYLVTGVYNPTSPGTMTIYVNNSPQGSRSVDSSGLRAYSGNQQIGGPLGINWPNPPPSQQQRVFNGSIYGVQTFDYVKTQAEIQTHYNIQDHPT